MTKLWLVAWHEYRQHVLKRSFLFALLSVPLLIAVLALVAKVPSLLDSMNTRYTAVGYVDHAGVLAGNVPVSTGSSEQTVQLIAFSTEEAATAALEAEEIEAHYVLGADYHQTRQVELVYIDEPGGDAVRQFREFLRVNLLADQSVEIAQRALEGSHHTVRSPDGRREFSGSLTLGQLLPALTGLALVALIFFSSGYLMQAVVEEKSNRTMEILVTSISSNQLMGGKVLGIIAVSVTQFLGWIVFAILAAIVGGQFLGVEWLQDLGVDPEAVLMMIALVVPAYVMAAALMTAIGAAFTEERASQQIVALFISFYMIPLGLIIPLMRTPNSSLAVGLSLFPLTAPVILPLRTLFTPVPLWQTAAAVAIQSLLALGAVWIAARTFRLGMLRYGKRLQWRELLGMAKPQSLAQSRRAVRMTGMPVGEYAAKSSGRSVGKTLLVLRHELITTVTKPMFVLTCVGIPLLILLQMAAMDAMSPRPFLGSRSGAVSAGDDTLATPELEVKGYVDRSGLIQTIPANIPPGMLVAYADEASARHALEAGKIAAFYVIPAEYVETGELVTIRPDFSPLSLNDQSSLMNWTLLASLLGGDIELAAQVWNPMELQESVWTPASDTRAADEGPSRMDEQDRLMHLLIPMLIALVLYGVILMASGMLLQSVSDEKKNRVMEILLLSVNPLQMLTGKIIALGIAGLLQAVVWGGMGYLFFALTGRIFSLPAGIELLPSLLVWGAVFFLLGYVMYASLMAGAGALVPDIKEFRMVSLMISAPAFVGFEIGLLTTDNPHGALATGASLFPLTAPFIIIKRLVVGGVPLWQLLMASGLLVVTSFFIVRAVARMFHAQNLLSGQRFSVKRYLRALLGRT